MKRLLVVTLVLVGVCSAAALKAQGREGYFNVESVQVKPIAVFRLDGVDYVAACNTPNNTLEIYSTSTTNDPQMLASVKTGLEPVSVSYHEGLERLFVSNFLGDSITAVDVDAPNGPSSFVATVADTAFALDEPQHVAFLAIQVDDGAGGTEIQETIVVAHKNLDAIGWRDAVTLEPLAPGLDRIDASLEFDLGLGENNPLIALKEPRAVQVVGDDVYVLGTKGGNDAYDFDIFCADVVDGSRGQIGGLGSTNLNMVADSSGNLWVTGGFARNLELFGEPTVASATTGFFESTIYLVQDPCGDNESVLLRDVNERPGPIAIDINTGEITAPPVTKGNALAMLTDLTLLETNGVVEKVFFTAFGSDRIGVLAPNLSQPIRRWPLRRLPVSPVNGNPIAGPRGVSLKRANSAVIDDTGDVLYVLNRLDNSVTIFNARTEAFLGDFSLSQDPTPEHIRLGQQFLYDHKLSGNGFVACASCHTDGRTDGLVWDLGIPGDPAVPIPATLTDAAVGGNPTEWPAEKGNIVTQTLQGLLNFDVGPTEQFWFTNAPYHWRGDREDFTKFNPAFVGLLGRDDELEDFEMDQFEDFINSIHYPPNPKQPLNRQYAGDFGDPNSLGDGSGVLFGLKLFHIGNSDGRSCSHCHALPEGSNNLITENAGQIIETAALRGLFQREARLDRGGSSFPPDSPFTGSVGLTSSGFVGSPFNCLDPDADPEDLCEPGDPFEFDANATASINGFNRLFFSGRVDFCGDAGAFCDNLQRVNDFVHQMDWGVGPLIGFPFSIDSTTDTSNLAGVFNFMEQQADAANSGLVVVGTIAGSPRGFVYDPTDPAAHSYIEVTNGQQIDRGTLVGLPTAPDDLLVFQGVPLGTERRIADPDGQPPDLTPGSPVNAQFLGTVPNTAYADVPTMTAFWDDFDTKQTVDNVEFNFFYIHMVRTFQEALVQNPGSGGSFGAGIRHEAARRLQVAAEGLELGAELHLFVPNDPAGCVTNFALPPEDSGQIVTQKLVLPLYPTRSTVGNAELWQTAAEIAPLNMLVLMNGGLEAPGVSDILGDFDVTLTGPPPTIDPEACNWHFVRLVNVGVGNDTDVGWQRLTMQ